MTRGAPANSTVKKPRRRGRPSRHEDSAETRTQLIDAAEQLFAERGFYGVTTREVATTAGVDDALIYYHFKNKRDLFDAVFERRALVLHTDRHESLVRYEKGSRGKPTIEGAIAAFINPMIDLSQQGDPGWKSYFALVAQIDNTPWGSEIINRYFDPIVYELIGLLRKVLPNTPEHELYWAYNFLAGSMMMALAETERVDRLSLGRCHAKDLDAVRHRLLAYCAGGFRAMISHAATAR